MWTRRILQSDFLFLSQRRKNLLEGVGVMFSAARKISDWTRSTGFPDQSEPTRKDLDEFMNLTGKFFSKELQYEWKTAGLEWADSESHWHGPVVNLLAEIFPLKDLYHVESQTRIYINKTYSIPDAAVSFKIPYVLEINNEKTLLWSKTRSVVLELKWDKSKDDERRILDQLRDYAAVELERKPHSAEILMIEMLPDKWRCFLASKRPSGPSTGRDSIELTKFIGWTPDPISDRSYCEFIKVKDKMKSQRPKIHSDLFKYFPRS